jgi:nucleoid-associated protein YgaU
MNTSPLKGLLKRIKLNESTISKILGALVIVVVGVLVFNYFRGVGQPEEEVPVLPGEVRLVEEEGKLYPEGLPTVHQVVAGEHLWAIAEQYYDSGYNWVDIAQENNLANPDQLLVGQELVIPRAAVIEPVVVEETVFGPAITDDQYTIQEGDHLWGIAVRAYGDGYQWVKIASENGLLDPDIVHPGNVLSLPR